MVFILPVSTSHRRMVWSQDALQTSSPSHQRTEDTASLCPDSVIRGVCIRAIRRAPRLRWTAEIIFSSHIWLCAHPGQAELLRLLLLPRSVRRLLNLIRLICGNWHRRKTQWWISAFQSVMLQWPPPSVRCAHLLTRSSTFCPRSRCRTEEEGFKLTDTHIKAASVTFIRLLQLYLWAGGVCGNGVDAPRVSPTAVSGFHLVPLRVPLPQQHSLVQRGRQEQRSQTICGEKQARSLKSRRLCSSQRILPDLLASSPLLIQATSLTTSEWPATVITAFPSADQILAVLS